MSCFHSQVVIHMLGRAFFTLVHSGLQNISIYFKVFWEVLCVLVGPNKYVIDNTSIDLQGGQLVLFFIGPLVAYNGHPLLMLNAGRHPGGPTHALRVVNWCYSHLVVYIGAIYFGSFIRAIIIFYSIYPFLSTWMSQEDSKWLVTGL